MDLVSENLIKKQLDYFKSSRSIADSGIDECEHFQDNMEESLISEMDMDYIKKKLVESEQEKSALAKRVEQLEADLQNIVEVALPKHLLKGRKSNDEAIEIPKQGFSLEASLSTDTKSGIEPTVKRKNYMKASNLDRRCPRKDPLENSSHLRINQSSVEKNPHFKFSQTLCPKSTGINTYSRLSKNSTFLPPLQHKSILTKSYNDTSSECIKKPNWFKTLNTVANQSNLSNDQENFELSEDKVSCNSESGCLPSHDADLDENKPIYITLTDRSCNLLRKCKPFQIVVEDCLVKKSSKTLHTKFISSSDGEDPSYNKKYKISDATQARKRYKMDKPVKKSFLASVPTNVSSAILNLKKNVCIPKKRKAKFQALLDVLSVYKSETVVFYILKYLSRTENFYPLLDYKNNQDISSPMEKCLVAVLNHFNSSSEAHDGILLTAVINIQHLILGFNNMNMHGFCALCRVFVLICKAMGNRKEALYLCCEILKVQHNYGPILVATVTCMWKELFEVPHSLSRKEEIFYGCLHLCALKWPDALSLNKGRGILTMSDWEISKSLLNKFMSVLLVNPDEETIEFILEALEESCGEDYMMTNALVIYAAYKGWNWAKEELIDKHIVNFIGRFIDAERNERLLTLFCKLYVEICIFYPSYNEPEILLFNLFDTGAEDEFDRFMQNAAATALIQFYLQKNESLPKKIQDWYDINKSNPKYSYLEMLIHKNDLAKKKAFTEEDML